jgi:hypothetical protein
MHREAKLIKSPTPAKNRELTEIVIVIPTMLIASVKITIFFFGKNPFRYDPKMRPKNPPK